MAVSLLFPWNPISSSQLAKSCQQNFGFHQLVYYDPNNSFRSLSGGMTISCSLQNTNRVKSHLAGEYRTNAKPQGLNEDVNVAEKETVSSLKLLIKSYREAILYGDEMAAANIEAKIFVIENKMNELQLNVSTLSSEITSGKEKYIRLQAEFDNFRKRSDKERLNIRNDAQGQVIESLLPMVDSFERAKQQLKPETDMEKKIDSSYQGIYKQFVEIMRSLRVAVVATVGKPFDPTVHEAIAREESEEYKEGIVTEEFRRGFRLGNRLIRPAMVKVSAGPGSKRSPVVTGQHAPVNGLDQR